MKHFISLGAGVQSSTMSLMFAHEELTPMPDGAIFADTQAEPDEVYRWLDWLEKQLPFPIHRVTKGNLWKENMRPRVSKRNGKTYYKRFVPSFGDHGMMPRKCTHDFKLVPIYQELRRLAAVKRGEKNVMVESLIGISTDEAHRMKPAKFPFVRNVYPLIDADISRTYCLEWMKARGYPTPPKSACVFCPFHDNRLWFRLKVEQPDEFAKAVAFEREMRATGANEFLHSSKRPLDQIDFRPEHIRQGQTMFEGMGFGNECEGMCGV